MIEETLHLVCVRVKCFLPHYPLLTCYLIQATHSTPVAAPVVAVLQSKKGPNEPKRGSATRGHPVAPGFVHNSVSFDIRAQQKNRNLCKHLCTLTKVCYARSASVPH